MSRNPGSISPGRKKLLPRHPKRRQRRTRKPNRKKKPNLPESLKT
jgi:hypothetical protein